MANNILTDFLMRIFKNIAGSGIPGGTLLNGLSKGLFQIVIMMQ